MAKPLRLTPLNFTLLLMLFSAITFTVALISLSIGSVEIAFEEMFLILSGSSTNEQLSDILLKIRLPRILLAAAVGGGLSVAGAVFQAILVNPLAEPYILGVSSGGTFGAILAMILGLSFIGIQFLSFAGALVVIFLVFSLSKRFGILEPNVMLLTGVMVGAFFSAAILLLISTMDNSIRSAVNWLIGNLSIADPDSAAYIFPVSVILALFLSLFSNKLNIISLGDEQAYHLGVNPARYKTFFYLLSSLLVGAVVSVSGIIGFVGLLVPHSCRLILGADNRIIVPASFFAGGSFLMISDTFARTVISPSELPVGAVTALLGAPLFVFLLKRNFRI